MRRSASNPSRIRRAFSLVEVLIAITVLALGLLGLASIFPVVISQQRDAQARLQAPAAIDGVRLQLLSGSEGLSATELAEVYAEYFDNLGATAKRETEGRFLSTELLAARAGPLFVQEGRYGYRYDSDGNGSLDADRIVPVTARIRPQPFSGSRPLFVFDLAVRGVSRDRALEDALNREVTIERVEIAVFLRPLDPGISVPADASLSGVLTGAGLTDAGSIRLPAGLSNETLLPSRDGTGSYAILLPARVRVDPDASNAEDALQFFRFANGTTEEIEQMASAPGQLLLDSTGVVREVVGTEIIDDEVFVRVSPAFPRGDGGETFYDIVFAPTAPVRVSVVGVPAR
ncbi:MAG: prepilin-type N-terminal cleavage/methylation domain-containing protein [Planctomycetota bacterium]